MGMLQATMPPSVAAKQIWCHVRMIGRLKNRFQQTWTTSDRLRSGHPNVLTWRQNRDPWTSYLCDRFHLETVTARTIQELIIPESELKLWEILFKRFVEDPNLLTFDGTLVWCSITSNLGTRGKTDVLMNWETGKEHYLAGFCFYFSNHCMLFEWNT